MKLDSIKIARIYLRVSTDEQDLTRQTGIEQSTRAAGHCIAGVYREKALGARAGRPELLRMIADLQLGEVVVAEKIDVALHLANNRVLSSTADFEDKGPGAGFRLKGDARRRFFLAYEARMTEPLHLRAGSTATCLRECVRTQAHALARALKESSPYQPLILR